MKIISRTIIVIGLFLALLPAYLNAAPLQYQATTEVEAGLRSGTLAEEFTFYFSGSRAEPHTIIAVRKNQQFDQSLWQEADSSPQRLQKWYEMIDNPHRPVRDTYWGGYIVDGHGKRLGVWYSKHRFRSAVLTEGILAIGRPFRQDNSSRRGNRMKR